MEAQIMLLANDINSNDKEKVMESTKSIRKLLSVETDPPIDMIVDIGIIVPRLIKFLDESSLPNLQFEAAWCLTNIASGTTEHCKIIVDYGVIPALMKLLNETQEINIIEQVIWAFGCISGDSTLHRDNVLETGVISYVVDILNDCMAINKFGFPITAIRTMLYALSNLMRSKPRPPYEIINPALPVFAKILYSSDIEILIDALWGLGYYSDSCSEEIIQKILETGVTRRLIELSTLSPKTQLPALRVICNLLVGDNIQTQILLNLNVLTHLEQLMKSKKKEICREACFAISNISAGTSSQIQEILENKTIVKTLISKLTLKTLDTATLKEATWCISNIINCGSTEQIEHLITKYECIKVLCHLLDRNIDISSINVALGAIDIIVKKGKLKVDEGIFKQNEYLRLIEDCGGISKIEALQIHPNNEIYQKAFDILSSFEEENQDDSVLNGIEILNI